MGDWFVCEKCGGSFITARSYEEAEKESTKIFGDIPKEDQATICDVCFIAFMDWFSKNSGASL